MDDTDRRIAPYQIAFTIWIQTELLLSSLKVAQLKALAIMVLTIELYAHSGTLLVVYINHLRHGNLWDAHGDYHYFQVASQTLHPLFCNALPLYGI